jgi:ribose/xylose/arabinose/galactoside ABC-type transport system permease subunit
MAPLGRMLITIGVVLVLFGLLVTFAGRLPFRFGRLPGDIVWHGRNSTFYFPLATCILLSLIFSLVMWLFRR